MTGLTEDSMSAKKYFRGRPTISACQALRDHEDEVASLDQETRHMLAELAEERLQDRLYGYSLPDLDDFESDGDYFPHGNALETPGQFDYL